MLEILFETDAFLGKHTLPNLTQDKKPDQLNNWNKSKKFSKNYLSKSF